MSKLSKDIQRVISAHDAQSASEIIEKRIDGYANLRIIEVLEEIYQESQFIKMWAAIGNKIKELKLRAVEDEKDDIKDLNTVGGGYGFKDISGC